MSFWKEMFNSFSELVQDSLFSQGLGTGYLAGVILSGEQDYYDFLEGSRDFAILRLLTPENKDSRVLIQHGSPTVFSQSFVPKAPRGDWDIQVSCHPRYAHPELRSNLFAPEWTGTTHGVVKVVNGLPCIYIFY